MYKLNVSPQDLKNAAKAVDSAQFSADVESVLKGVDRKLTDFVNAAKHSPSKGSTRSITYEDHTKSVAVLEEVVRALTAQGFKAKVSHDDAYEDGPGSVHSSPARDYITISLV
jgi:hypothetical protein